MSHVSVSSHCSKSPLVAQSSFIHNTANSLTEHRHTEELRLTTPPSNQGSPWLAKSKNKKKSNPLHLKYFLSTYCKTTAYLGDEKWVISFIQQTDSPGTNSRTLYFTGPFKYLLVSSILPFRSKIIVLSNTKKAGGCSYELVNCSANPSIC